MSLNSTLSIATSGLGAVSRQLAVVSQNVANVGTPGYAEETATQSAVFADGQGMGVRTGPARIDVNAQLQAAAWNAQSAAKAASTTHDALSAIDQVAGSTSSATAIADQLGALRNQFSALEAAPSNQVSQRQVVNQAEKLAGAVNQLADAVSTGRQNAQDSLVQQVGQLNKALADVGQLSSQIFAAKAAGQGTADLEQTRNSRMSAISQLIGVKFVPQANGAVQAIMGGLSVQLDGATSPAFQIASAQLSPDTATAAVPGITLGGQDVTAQLSGLGGSIGANLRLRDRAMPQMQAELDEFAYALASSFSGQGLDLFTDGAGAVPSGGGSPRQSGYLGFAQTIAVNPAVIGDPGLVQQGTTGGALSSGSTAVLRAVLANTFGPLSTGTPGQPISGLGVDGTVSTRFATPTSLAAFATAIGSAQAQDVSNAADSADAEQATAAAMQNKLSIATGVSIDTELSHMIALQNAYSANARVLTAANAMMNSLLAAVQP